ncbi:hypothetical protein SBV1_1610001 [Verrucomicrobia bacterium]|nr:hypothetical protein SBV1_1610001 [Verrucomicrobiota bacterium]
MEKFRGISMNFDPRFGKFRKNFKELRNISTNFENLKRFPFFPKSTRTDGGPARRRPGEGGSFVIRHSPSHT